MSEYIEYTEPFWRNLNLRQLKVDEAYVNLISWFENTTYLYSLSEQCYTCPFTIFKELHPGEEESIAINTAYPLKFKILPQNVGRYAFDNVTDICTFKEIKSDEFGVYNLTVDRNGTCEFVEDKPGVNVTLPILTMTILVTFFLMLIKISLRIWRRFYHFKDATIATRLQKSKSYADLETGIQHKRMRSLDTIRGMAIVLMIFVNSGDGKYKWIGHAVWNGLHVADVVFPSFLWIMGVCIPISVKLQLGRNATKFSICRKIFLRSVKLFMIGLCLNSINRPQMSGLRIMGVLQRFGIAYFVCGILHTICTQRQLERWKHLILDILVMRWELIISFLLIIVYLGVTFGLNVPGCPKGYTGPGGKHAFSAYPNCIGGATGYIDNLVLGTTHIFQHLAVTYIYDSKAFDPANLFGCVLTIVQVFIGVQAGMITLVYPRNASRIKRWTSWSLILAMLGGTLCMFSIENGIIPINQKLWSLSFVFVTSGLAFFLLAFSYRFVDMWRIWSGSPFAECGMNAILLYVGHMIIVKTFLWYWRIGPMNSHFIWLLKSTLHSLLWIAVALYFDSKRFYYNL